jgi:hypothetical protein
MIVAVDLAIHENVLDDCMKTFIVDEIEVVEDVNMPSVKDLQDSHLRLIKDMHSACCLSVHPNAGGELLLYVYLIDVGLVDKSDARLIKAKVFHIKGIFWLGWALF